MDKQCEDFLWRNSIIESIIEYSVEGIVVKNCCKVLVQTNIVYCKELLLRIVAKYWCKERCVL